MKCETCGNDQIPITELVVIDSFSAVALTENGPELNGFGSGRPSWWCENCRGSIKVLVEDMEAWSQERKELLQS